VLHLASTGKYRVQIEGKNFLVDMNGKVAKHGFITLRFVEADDPSVAENTAVQMLRNDQRLRGLVKNDGADPPVMDVLEIVELESADEMDQQPGLIWYPVNPKRWWQFWRR
jgi:hypothetical protein